MAVWTQNYFSTLATTEVTTTVAFERHAFPLPPDGRLKACTVFAGNAGVAPVRCALKVIVQSWKNAGEPSFALVAGTVRAPSSPLEYGGIYWTGDIPLGRAPAIVVEWENDTAVTVNLTIVPMAEVD